MMLFSIKHRVKMLVRKMALVRGRTIFSKLDLKNQNVKYLLTVQEEHWVWHRRLGHVSLRNISQLNKLGLVRGLPNLKYTSDALCEACKKGKFSKTSFKAKKIVSTFRPLELLHVDLFEQVKTASVNGKKSGLVIVDDYSR